MTELARLTLDLDALETTHSDIVALGRRTDLARRYELVQLRRKLSAQILQVGQSGDRLFASIPTVHEEFRRRHAAMRSAAALHQAEWPAVRLGEADETYRRSAAEVRQANSRFVGWVRDVIAAGGVR